MKKQMQNLKIAVWTALFCLVLIGTGFLCYPVTGGMPPENSQSLRCVQGAGLDLNRASAGALQCLKGVGEKKALAIIAYREGYGPFHAIEEVTRVSGIGEKLLEQMKDHVWVMEGEEAHDAR